MLPTIDTHLKGLCPQLRIACIQGHVTVCESPPELLRLLEQTTSRFAGASAEATIPTSEIASTRQAYKALGKEPSRYRSSAESLLRRVLSGKGLYTINNVVEINNLVSLESLASVGSYDVAKVSGQVIFRSGHSGEGYKAIGKDVINIADLPVFCDENGPFGSPTSDSERAMITFGTREIAMMIISFGGASELPAWAERALTLLKQFAHGIDLVSIITD